MQTQSRSFGPDSSLLKLAIFPKQPEYPNEFKNQDADPLKIIGSGIECLNICLHLSHSTTHRFNQIQRTRSPLNGKFFKINFIPDSFMKKITLFSLIVFALPSLIHAQFTGPIVPLGFTIGNTTVDHFTWTNTQTGGPNQLTTTQGGKASAVASYPSLGVEAYGKHFMFETTFGYGLKHKMKEYADITSKDRTALSMRLAFGFTIKNCVGLMIGLHEQYVTDDFSKSASGDPTASTGNWGPGTFFVPGVGGWMPGFNLNVLVSLSDHFLIRGTFLRSGITRSNKVYKGQGQQFELASYYCFNEDKTFGVFCKFTAMSRKMDPLGKEGSTYIPAFGASSTLFSIGILLPGSIFGGSEYQSTKVSVTPN
jgi:hypothetical protein